VNKPITITATVAAWFTSPDSIYERDRLEDAIEKQDGVAIIGALHFYKEPGSELKFMPNWICMGEADITLRLITKDERTRAAVHALHNKLAQLRSAYQQKQREILAEISKYEALTNEVEA